MMHAIEIHLGQRTPAAWSVFCYDSRLARKALVAEDTDLGSATPTHSVGRLDLV